MLVYFGHLAPTAPNTLEIKHDSEKELILEHLPDYLITSTDEQFSMEDIKDTNGQVLTTLVLIPRFEVHKKIYIVDFNKKEYKSIGF